MSYARHILLLAAMLIAVTVVRAQFSLNTVGESANIPVPLSLRRVPLSVDVINESKARTIRKAIWRDRNAVDFKISLTGWVSQYNKSWTANNQNSISGELSAYYYHTYTKGRVTSRFKFDGIYGMNYLEELWFKNQDMFKVDYLASWSLSGRGFLRNWAYSASTIFQSQFTRGFKGRAGTDREIPWSNFLAPATLTVGLGITYTSPDKRLPFVVTMNPISGNALFVADDGIADDRRVALGIPVARDADGNPINYKFQGGSNLNVSFNRTFAFGKKKGVTFQYNTTLTSFYGWITQVSRHTPADEIPPPEIMPTVNWSNTLTFRPLKFISLDFRTTAIYDKSQVDKVQMEYYLRVGLTYGYKNR